MLPPSYHNTTWCHSPEDLDLHADDINILEENINAIRKRLKRSVRG
jgi:hypothetical protein